MMVDGEADDVDDDQSLELVGLRTPSETGAYKCTAHNEAGSAQDIATVFVQQRSDDARLPAVNDRTSHQYSRRPKRPLSYPDVCGRSGIFMREGYLQKPNHFSAHKPHLNTVCAHSDQNVSHTRDSFQCDVMLIFGDRALCRTTEVMYHGLYGSTSCCKSD